MEGSSFSRRASELAIVLSTYEKKEDIGQISTQAGYCAKINDSLGS